MTLIVFLYAMAVWRISKALSKDDGIGDIFKKLREKTDSVWSPLRCICCTSVFVSLALCWVYGLGFFYIFALSGIAIIIDAIYERIA